MQPKQPSSSSQLQPVKATAEHCRYCFQVLTSKLNKQPLPKLPPTIPNISAPLFVTWNLKQMLRGCIGTFQAQPLSESLAEFALYSAMKDDRFPPITKPELPFLSVSVSLLVDFQKGRGKEQWVIGEHGVILEFEKDGRSYEATFLPEVAKEENWDHKTTLRELVEKSGYTKPYETVQDVLRITTYRSDQVTMTYNQFIGKK